MYDMCLICSYMLYPVINRIHPSGCFLAILSSLQDNKIKIHRECDPDTFSSTPPFGFACNPRYAAVKTNDLPIYNREMPYTYVSTNIIYNSKHDFLEIQSWKPTFARSVILPFSWQIDPICYIRQKCTNCTWKWQWAADFQKRVTRTPTALSSLIFKQSHNNGNQWYKVETNHNPITIIL